jgi:hypothetical protein
MIFYGINGGWPRSRCLFQTTQWVPTVPKCEGPRAPQLDRIHLEIGATRLRPSLLGSV